LLKREKKGLRKKEKKSSKEKKKRVEMKSFEELLRKGSGLSSENGLVSCLELGREF
jgi:hypothetical protein